jgi:hypothetical protein
MKSGVIGEKPDDDKPLKENYKDTFVSIIKSRKYEEGVSHADDTWNDPEQDDDDDQNKQAQDKKEQEFLKKQEILLQLTAPMPSDDKPSNLISGYTTNIASIPSTGETATIPWSGYYWALRYGDTSMRYVKGTKNTYGLQYSTSVSKYKQPAEHKAYYLKSGWNNYVKNNYSAAEKYDLLVGDYGYTYTNKQKKIWFQIYVYKRRCCFLDGFMPWMVPSCNL